MATVTFEKIFKSYDGTHYILNGIDLSVRDGEFIVLVGPSGCGKTTLLRTLAGLETPDRGIIRIGETEVTNLPPKDRDIAMVFQSYALYPHMTVRENIAFGLKIRRMPADEITKRVTEAASLLGISHLLDRYPRQMSGGQRQRVAIGRAIVRRPKVFLFDEPLSNLDAALRSQMRIEIKELHRRLATTIVYVTHDQVEAMTLADRIVVLDKGVIQQIGTPEELYRRPANTFVARFIGTPAMNLLSVTRDRDRLVAPGIALPLPAGLPDRPILAGIRPTDLTPSGDQAQASVNGTVSIVEPLGATNIVHLVTGNGTSITIEGPADLFRHLTAGISATFAAQPDQIHLFDAETGARIG